VRRFGPYTATQGSSHPPRDASRNDDSPAPPGDHAAADFSRHQDDGAWSEALYLGLVKSSDAPLGAEPTRSELERRLLPALKAAGLPEPVTNHRFGRYRPDFYWPHHRLMVETDGWKGHGHRMAFESDRARDADLQAQGFAVLRFTWRQVMEQALLVTVRIAQVLARTPHHALDTPPAGG